MRGIAFIGNPSKLKPGSKENTGNIVHGYAARSLFANPIRISSSLNDENIEKVRASISHVSLVAATTLCVNRAPSYIDSHTAAADFIEKLDLPVCVFGLGSLAPSNQTIQDANVDERSIRLLRVVSERSHSIAVRGHFTADLCRKYGVKNVTVTGCQSCYTSVVRNWSDDHLGKPIDARRPFINVSTGSDDGGLLEHAISHNIDVIGQNDPVEEGIKNKEIAFADFMNNWKDYPIAAWIKRLLLSGRISPERYFHYISNRFYKFYEMEDWSEHIRHNYDFCVGTRFHGNMAALYSGVPALWVAHDMRTIELCEFLNLPFIPHDSINRISTMKQLAELCDYSELMKKFPTLLNNFMDYLRKNGVDDLLDESFVSKSKAITDQTNTAHAGDPISEKH